MKIKILKFFSGIEKYIFIVVVGLIVIYLINIVGVELFGVNPYTTYFIALSINYIISYFGNAKAFGRRVNKNNLYKFIIVATVFFILNNYIFYLLVKYLNLYYLIAISINFLIFPLMKFLSYKYIVFEYTD